MSIVKEHIWLFSETDFCSLYPNIQYLYSPYVVGTSVVSVSTNHVIYMFSVIG